jgi:hypothetical protein
MIKRKAFLFLMSVIGVNGFTMRPITEGIYVRNFSSKTVIISREFIADVNDADYNWKQDISGGKYDLFINVSKAGFITDVRKLAPNGKEPELIIFYYPWPTASFSFDGEPWESKDYLWKRFDQIPFMEKVHNIFKSLRIATEDGSKVITLENLGEQVITKSGRDYIIEIYD